MKRQHDALTPPRWLRSSRVLLALLLFFFLSLLIPLMLNLWLWRLSAVRCT